MEWLSLWIVCYLLFIDGKGKEIKRLRKRIKRLERKTKGGNEMSRLLEELKGQKVKVMVGELGMNFDEIVDVDEDWAKLSRTDNKGNVTTKLVRVEAIQSVELK